MDTTDEKRLETADKAEISTDGPVAVEAKLPVWIQLREPSAHLRVCGIKHHGTGWLVDCSNTIILCISLYAPN
jgi:hypothetical protein